MVIRFSYVLSNGHPQDYSPPCPHTVRDNNPKGRLLWERVKDERGQNQGKNFNCLVGCGNPNHSPTDIRKNWVRPFIDKGLLVGLIKAKYVSVPQKNYCAITDQGKEAIGLPQVDKNLALEILSPLPIEKAFHFYYDIDQPSGVHADSLKDFVDKIQNVDLKSIEFHIPRKDFECWVSSLGDIELSKKLGLLRIANLSGENLRKELYETVNSRCEELKKLTV